MPKLVIMDQMLRDKKGHYFEYDVQMLAGAQLAGWQPILAANRDFADAAELSPEWQVVRAFHDPGFPSVLHKLYAARRKLATAGRRKVSIAQWYHRINCWRYGWRYSRRKNSYGDALDQIFSECRLETGDQILVPTALPFAIAELAHWARRRQAAQQVDWHLLLHFPLVEAATWYARGNRPLDDLLGAAPLIFEDLRRALPRGNVHLYATTPSLAAHLEHCLQAPFATLPYPVNPALATLRRGTKPGRPLRVSSPGAARAEKQGQHWPRLVEVLSADYLATGRVQLAVQAQSSADIPAPLRKFVDNTSNCHEARHSPVICAPWPLPAEEYLQFLAGADIGLLMYDPATYHVRCSAVLMELLSAGVPSIVPAGSALADELAEPNFAHHERVREPARILANVTNDQFDWKAGLQNPKDESPIVAVDTPEEIASAAVARTDVPSGATHALVQFHRDEPNPFNRYASVTVRQFGGRGEAYGTSCDVVSPRASGRPATVLVPLRHGCRQIEIELKTALGHEPVVYRGLECCFLDAPGPVPRGAVGLAASDADQVADCLRDIVDHYQHYAQTAADFATIWARKHTAGGVIDALTRRAADPYTGPHQALRKVA
jgi:hypothetical protein